MKPIPDYLYGWMKNKAFGANDSGLTIIGTRASLGTSMEEYKRGTMAHEAGHALSQQTAG